MYKYKSLQEVQLPREHLSFLQNFIITKYLKQEVDDDLSVCVDERSSCGLSITGDIKTYQCHMIKRQWCCYHQQRSVLSSSTMELLLLLKFDNGSSSLIQDKEICQVIMSQCHHYHLRWSIQWNSFNHVYQVSKFDVSSFSVTGKIQIFKS